MSDSQVSDESDEVRAPPGFGNGFARRLSGGIGGGEASPVEARPVGHDRRRVERRWEQEQAAAKEDEEEGEEGEQQREGGHGRRASLAAAGVSRSADGARDGRRGIGGGWGRALPMLWPPPKSCTVLGDQVCRIPSQVVVRMRFSGGDRLEIGWSHLFFIA